MIARREFHQSAVLRKLYGRDGYVGVSQPVVATPAETAELVEMHRAYPGLSLALQDSHGLRAITVIAPDDPRLLALTATDRVLVQAALSSLHREVSYAA